MNGAREAVPGELGSQNFPGRGEGASFSSGRERGYGVFSVLDAGFRKGRGTRALNWRCAQDENRVRGGGPAQGGVGQ